MPDRDAAPRGRHEAPRTTSTGDRRWSAVLAIAAVTLVAAGLRLWNVGYPPVLAFDEFYYAKSACIFLGGSQERCIVEDEGERYWYEEERDTGAWVHPPLGKWSIALGEAIVGFDGSDGLAERDLFAARLMPAIAGTLTVLAFAILLQVLLGSVLWTVVGGLLLATEGLSLVQSRVAMLDVFVTLWIVVAVLLIVLDRRWITGRTAAGGPGDVEVPSPLWRPYRFAAGIALGLGLASKWSALTAVGVVGLLTLLAEFSRRRRAGDARWFPRALLREGFGIGLALVLVPLVVYLVTYLPWFAQGGSLAGWIDLQERMLAYHGSLRPIDPATMQPVHPYLSSALRWMALTRPVLYFAQYSEDGGRAVIYALGNPGVFWTGIAAIPTAAWLAWKRADDAAVVAVVAFLGMYLPWFFVDRPQFLFYALPLVPFIVLAIVAMLRYLRETRATPVAVALVVVALGLAAWFWPMLTGARLSPEAWELRAWFPTWT